MITMPFLDNSMQKDGVRRLVIQIQGCRQKHRKGQNFWRVGVMQIS
jgi:hypothetical protein